MLQGGVAELGDYKIVLRRAADLIPYARNSRTHSDEQVAKIMASLVEFGWTNPALVSDGNKLVAGHGRTVAALRLYEQGKTIKLPGGGALPEGMVPTIDCTGWSEAQERAYIIADNALAAEAGWDAALLKLELDDLASLDFNLDLLGFSADNLAAALGPQKGDGDTLNEGLTDPDAVPGAPKEPVTVPGDVWLCGGHRVMCGDSTVVTDVEKLMSGMAADMVFTDPPYGIEYGPARRAGLVKPKEYDDAIANDDLDGGALGNLICNVFLFNKAEADVYVCCSPLKQKPFLDAVDQAERKIEAVIVWNKEQPGLGFIAYRRQCEFILFVKGRPFRKGDRQDFDLWNIGRDRGVEYVHGTQKPVALPIRAIQNSSKAGDIVLDLFGGSGSTLIACQQTDRLARMMELDARFVDVIVMRWQEFTGQVATLEGSGRTFVEMMAERVPETAIGVKVEPAKKGRRRGAKK